jgi:hypothetical protein
MENLQLSKKLFKSVRVLHFCLLWGHPDPDSEIRVRIRGPDLQHWKIG